MRATCDTPKVLSQDSYLKYGESKILFEHRCKVCLTCEWPDYFFLYLSFSLTEVFGFPSINLNEKSKYCVILPPTVLGGSISRIHFISYFDLSRKWINTRRIPKHLSEVDTNLINPNKSNICLRNNWR